MHWKVTAEHCSTVTREEIRKIWKNILADTAEHAIEFARILDDLNGQIYWPPGTNWTAEEEK